ncbi:MAG: amino acid ABC transporter substrate-binding protein [Sulfolobales archaeon]
MVRGVSRLIVITAVVVVLVAIASFFGGIQVGRSVAPQAVTQILTVTAPQRVTVTQTVLQTITAPVQIVTTPTPTPTPPIQLPDKIVLGMAVPLSGSQADAGRRGFWGVLAAIKWVNEVYGGVHLYGKAIPLELKYYDDESKKENTIAYTERLITVDKVNFLLSTYSSPLVFAQAPVAEKYKMLLVNWGGAGDEINAQGYKYVVTVWTPASMYLWTALYALKQIDPKATKVAIMYKDDEFNRAAGEGAVRKAQELGYTIVYQKVYPPTINDFTPYITDLARSGADALIVSAHYPDGLLLTKQLADANVNFKLIAINVAPCLQDYYNNLKTLAEGILCPSQWEPTVNYNPDLAKNMGVEWFGPTTDVFMKYFVNVTGNPNILPSYHTGSAAAAVLLLVKAIEVAQSLDPSAVREAFNKLYLMTFFGLFKIDPATGKQLAHEMVLGQWQGGKFVVVWPQSVAIAKLYYPIPTWDEKRAGKLATYS